MHLGADYEGEHSFGIGQLGADYLGADHLRGEYFVMVKLGLWLG